MSDAPPTDPRSLAVPGTEIVVRVTPNASREQVTLDGSRFVIRVTCVPEDGKANKAVIAALAKACRLPKSSFSLVAGETDRHKTILVTGNPAEVEALIARSVNAGKEN